MFTDKIKQEINETETKLQEVKSKSVIQVPIIQVWIPYKTFNNLTELTIGSIHKVTTIGYAKHYATDKLVVQLEAGIKIVLPCCYTRQNRKMHNYDFPH